MQIGLCANECLESVVNERTCGKDEMILSRPDLVAATRSPIDWLHAVQFCEQGADLRLILIRPVEEVETVFL